jgi:hypothetical protein
VASICPHLPSTAESAATMLSRGKPQSWCTTAADRLRGTLPSASAPTDPLREFLGTGMGRGGSRRLWRISMIFAINFWRRTQIGRTWAAGTTKFRETRFPKHGYNSDKSRWWQPDLTFRAPDGSNFYVNTVDTLSDGATPDLRETVNAWFISRFGSGPVFLYPKP